MRRILPIGYVLGELFDEEATAREQWTSRPQPLSKSLAAIAIRRSDVLKDELHEGWCCRVAGRCSHPPPELRTHTSARRQV